MSIAAPDQELELTALLATLDDVDPRSLTSCPGWTAHHIAAHICGNYEEIRRHVEAFGAGHQVGRTRSWDEREAPLRDLHHATLLQRIDGEATRTAAAVEGVLRQHPLAELTWTGRTVRISGFPTHLRSENAIHRWDLVGDDHTSHALLDQQDLLTHAVAFVGRPLLRSGQRAGAALEPLVARVRCGSRDDLIVEARGGDAHLSVAPPDESATIEADPAARLLLLWGRQPTPFHRLRATRDLRAAAQVCALLAGY